MALIAAKCPECGAEIEVNTGKEAGICQHCGNAFVTARAINQGTGDTRNLVANENNFNGNQAAVSMDSHVNSLIQAQRELQMGHYSSYELLRHLDDVRENIPNGSQKIIEMFQEAGLYQMAEKSISQEEKFEWGLSVIILLTRYDNDNILGWLMEWKKETKWVKGGQNILRLAPDSEKEAY